MLKSTLTAVVRGELLSFSHVFLFPAGAGNQLGRFGNILASNLL